MSSVKNYDVLCTVGSGSFGRCQKIRRKSDGKILAWKVMSYRNIDERLMNTLIQEVALLQKLNHPNIVQYYDHFVDNIREEVYIVMEYCEGGDLSDLIKDAVHKGSHVKEEFIFQVLVQLAAALKHCHRRPDGGVVLHQDLKPANVFLHQNRSVMLGDFGLAEILPTKDDFATSKAGTRRYMCPEKMNGRPYNEKSDIWSLGCLLYYLCALEPPFTAGGGKSLSDSISSGKFRRIPSRYSDKLNSLIRDMLHVSDDMRPSAEDILHRSQQTDTVAEEKARDSDHPLTPPTPPADLRRSKQQLQKLRKRKRKLEPAMVAEEKPRDPDHPLPPPTPPADLRPSEQQLQKPKKRKRKLEPE